MKGHHLSIMLKWNLMADLWREEVQICTALHCIALHCIALHCIAYKSLADDSQRAPRQFCQDA